MTFRIIKAFTAGASLVAVSVLLGGGLASASTTAVPKAIVGCWHRHAPALPVGTAPGTWQIEVTRTGELRAYTPGMAAGCKLQPDFTGMISVAGRQLTIGPLPVCSAKGIFTWKAGARSLTLQATEDGCPSRKLLFSGMWRRN